MYVESPRPAPRPDHELARAIPLPPRPPLLGARTAAFVVDALLVGTVVTAAWIGLVAVLTTLGVGVERHEASLGIMLSVVLVATLTPLLGGIYLVTTTARGGSIGMRLFGLRVQRPDGSDPGYGAAALRVALLALLGPLVAIGFLHGRQRAYHDAASGLEVVPSI